MCSRTSRRATARSRANTAASAWASRSCSTWSQLHGGTVHAESAGIDQGATFTVTFPLARKVSASRSRRRAERAQPLDRPGKTKRYDALVDLRVLFIDDDLRTREAVQEVLALTGARVELAASVAEGLAAVEAFKPQVILCDIAMPDEDGYAFVRKLRARGADKAAPIPALALTALVSDDDKRRALAAGFQTAPGKTDRHRSLARRRARALEVGETSGRSDERMSMKMMQSNTRLSFLLFLLVAACGGFARYERAA